MIYKYDTAQNVQQLHIQLSSINELFMHILWQIFCKLNVVLLCAYFTFLSKEGTVVEN